jgi:hypothetical protein
MQVRDSTKRRRLRIRSAGGCALSHRHYKDSMGQQHRVGAKRKRRKAYLRRKKAAAKPTRREPAVSKPKKQAAAAEQK